MGGLSLTNPGLAFPDGSIDPTTRQPIVKPRVQFFPNNAARALAFAKQQNAAVQPSTSDVSGGIAAPGETPNNVPSVVAPPSSPVPSFFKPSFSSTTTDPTTGMQAPVNAAQTKLGKLVSILGAAARGAIAGYGYGNAAQGAAAAREVPFQEAEQRAQLQQQGAQTALTREQASMVPTPYGPMPLGMARYVFPSLINAGAKVQSANIGAQSRESVANTNAVSRMNVEQMKFAIQNGQIAHVEDGLDPTTGQPAKIGYTRTGQLVGVLPGSFPSSAYLPKATDTTDFREDVNGNIVALPKRTTSQPVFPGGVAPSSAGGAASPAPQGDSPRGASQPRGPRIVAQGRVPAMVTGSMPDGTQVAGTPAELSAVGATGVTKLEGSNASQVSIARQMTAPGGLFDLAQKDLAKFKPGELDALGSRWNEFLAGSVGTGDPRYVALRTHVNGLLGTALMQAHGVRGKTMAEHFQNIADAGQMNQATLSAALDAEKQYVNEKAMRPPSPSSHIFSLSAWQAANPHGDPAAAKAFALKQGYQVAP
jgi:hypothetical protein